jgi:ribokinase
MSRIVVVGSINMDLVMRTPRLPVLGETLLGGPFSTAEGGKGANQSVACARMGASVEHIGRLGADPFGERLRGVLEAEGVGVSGVRLTPGASTGVAQICIVGGDNSIIVAPGANASLTPEDLRASSALFEGAHIALFQLEVPLETVREGLGLARERGLVTLLNPAPWQELPEGILERTDLLVLNRIELEQCAGTGDPERAYGLLRPRGIRTLILTAGGEGAFWVTETAGGEPRSGRVPAPRVDVVDSTGAGDTFVGALAVALSEGRSLEEAVRFGVCAGALACTRLGAMPGIPRRDQVEALLRGR